jgi:hypothetical protein
MLAGPTTFKGHDPGDRSVAMEDQDGSPAPDVIQVSREVIFEDLGFHMARLARLEDQTETFLRLISLHPDHDSAYER